jgi:diacylglycerol O-acyltransferase
MRKLMPPADAMFLIPETADQYMHVGSLQVFELPEGADRKWVRELYERQIASEQIGSLFRRRPYRSLATLGAWTWEVDADIDLEHHVRHDALPDPGRVRELLALTSYLHSTPLDRHRPLWEAHVIEGLEGNRFAVYTKLHHSLMDGVSAMKLLERTLSSDPDERDMPPPWAPRSPSRRRQSRDGGGSPMGSAGKALRGVLDMVGTVPRLVNLTTKVLTDQAAGLPSPAPQTMFNVGITGSRRYAAQSWPLDRVKQIAKKSGGTINDVILAMSSSALRAYLKDLGELPDAPLVAMTPVSLRTEDQDRRAGSDDGGGNSVGVILCSLATHLSDPVERLEAIHDSMQWGKDALSGLSQTQMIALSAVALTPLALGVLPVTRYFSRPPFNVVISNVPGPSGPLYYDGAYLQGMYPLSIPTHGQALNVTVTSYNGNLAFGLTGDRRRVPHLQRLLGHLDRGLRELYDAVVG